MTPRVRLMLAAVAVLVVVNLWRWWPQTDTMTEPKPAAQASSVENLDLQLAGYDPDDSGEVNIQRDLFFPAGNNEPEAAAVEVEEKQQPEQQVRTSQRETILRELEQYKLVGILSRNGVKQGFLVRDENNFTVRAGGRLEKRYSVDEITLTSVTLSDPASRVSRKIELE